MCQWFDSTFEQFKFNIFIMNKKLINFLISLKNNSLLKKEFVLCNYSFTIKKICALLYKEGLIQSYTINQNKIKVFLRYSYDKPILKDLSLISKPSNHRSLSFVALSRLSTKRKVFFLSTDLGFFTSLECRKYNKGGVVLFSC